MKALQAIAERATDSISPEFEAATNGDALTIYRPEHEKDQWITSDSVVEIRE